jgi:exodeoxyribonuclease VII small subunit
MTQKTQPGTPTTYSAAAEELDEIVERLQGNEVIDVDTLVEDVARAKELFTYCSEKINNADRKIKDIVKGMVPDASPAAESESEGETPPARRASYAEPVSEYTGESTGKDAEIPF